MVLATRETATQRHWTCGRRLRERRHALGLTQAELVARIDAEPAITNRSISTWENGRGLDFGWLPELATALDCSVTYLLGMTDDPQRWEPTPDTRAATADGGGDAATAAAAEPAPTSTDVTRHWILGPGPVLPDGDGSPSSDRKPE